MLSFARLRRVVPLLLATAVLAACGDDDDTTAPTLPNNIVATAQATPQLSTLVTALTAADLTGTLSGPGPFTVFAPVNNAFDALPAGQLNALLEAGNVDILSKVLTYHVVPGTFRAADLTEGQTLTTVEGTEITVSLAGGARVNGARITTTDVETSNGVVHLIDGVLTESLDIVDVATIRGFSSLVSAVAEAGLVNAVRGSGTGDGITVFAPTNAAFSALGALPGNPALSDVLTYHVVDGVALAASLSNNQELTTLQGGTVQVLLGPPLQLQGVSNTVNITATDIVAKNGVSHVLDAVLDATPAPTQTIAELAGATPSLSTLATAVGAANLGATLSGAGPFTVFAPVNTAFAAVPADQLARLLETGNVGVLSKLLTYHVVPGIFRAADLTEGQTLTTVEGTQITVSLAGGAKVNNANITATDIEATNGVVHLIDGVLTESLDIVDVATIRGFSSLVGAVATSGLVDAVRGNGSGGGITVFAPTNAAFAALGALPVNPALSDVLTYHVVDGVALAASLNNNQVITTLQTGTVQVRLGPPLQLVGAGSTVNIVATDVVAKNGVIHVIDAVLLPNAPVTQNVVELAGDTPALSTLATAVAATGLESTLAGTGPFTVFAPVNSAFNAVPADQLARLLQTGNVAVLSKLLRYHVVPGTFRAADLTEGKTLTTVEGTTITVSLAGGAKVNNAKITATDIEATNGVVHLIDGVLTESLDIVDVATIRGFSSLVGAVAGAGLVDAVRGNGSGGGITVFAPTNAAFAALGALPANPALTNVLTYHVVDGVALAASLNNNQVIPTLQTGTVQVRLGPPLQLVGLGSTVNVVATDIVAKNGVIHVIDAVLIPTAPPLQNISALAGATPALSTLTAALTAAKLTTTLAGPGPFTVFAPVNSAFDAVPADQVARLLQTGNIAILSKLLRYHVVPGTFRAADLTEGQTLTTVEGTTLTISLAGGARVNNANIVTTNIEAANGVVHLIDGVLTESLDVVDVATVLGLSSLVNAVKTAGLESAVRGNGSGNGITLFAPSNSAFNSFGALPGNPALTQVLTAHVLDGRQTASSFQEHEVVQSLQGGNISFLLNPLRVGGESNTERVIVSRTDIVAKNGVIHLIAGVILP